MIYRRYRLEEANNPWVKNPTEKSIFGGDLTITSRALHALDLVLHNKHPRFAISRA